VKAKVVIVGGGVMGVSIAWHAAARSDPIEEPVVLLEKKALAAGSSGRSGAILRQFYSQREVAAMARDSLQVYAGFERRTGRSIGFQRTGVLTLAGPERPDDIALVERNIAMQVEIGIDTRRVDAHEIRRLVPGISVRDGSVGAFEPGAGGVDPVAAVEAMAALARERGAVTLVGTGATGFLRRGGRIVGVQTDRDAIEAEVVIVAAGPWTRRLLLGIGIELPLRVVAPEQHFVAMPPGSGDSERDDGEGEAAGGAIGARSAARSEGLEPAAHPVLLDLEKGFYARCESHASREDLPAPRTRVGRMDTEGDAEIEDPDAPLESVGPEYRAWARRSLESRMPVYLERPDVGAFVGMYTLSPDSQALIGPIAELPGLIVVGGFSGHGFKLAPSIGEGVAQMIRGEPVSAFDVGFFAPDRFKTAAARGAPRGFGL
jgi:sarcosine oxidase subunit beta